MKPARALIVNADDFGQSSGVNDGIVEAHVNGIVTSASLMVRWPSAAEAAHLASQYPALSVGLHIDLGEWYLAGDEWRPSYEVVRLQDGDAVRAEAERQIAHFIRLTGRHPTHIDSHQHVHTREPARTIVLDIARRLQVPVRRSDERIRYCGEFYGQDENGISLDERISVEAMLGLLARLPEGTTEMCCHPAARADLETMYSTERLSELAVLCDSRVRRAIGELGIELRSFHNGAR